MRRSKALYIGRHPDGTWYYRRTVVKTIRHLFDKPQFLFSLQTRNKQEAIRKSVPYTEYFDKIFEQLTIYTQLARVEQNLNIDIQGINMSKKRPGSFVLPKLPNPEQ